MYVGPLGSITEAKTNACAVITAYLPVGGATA
jgi:hypothetical protein